ncbi:dipeptide/oligopeptide/nickel ABC transporter ATP-binding protein [Bacillus sp. CMF12]|uniref:ABC transporter ATP-binding protein n=1 Tax=Bacillaceae TaxID=186817 RepID=UPI001FB4E923|nr:MULTISPECIES: dipeptide/oligopeptide/nickel ABC transporter ATP-binding protein [Bacillaceae]UOE57374.1 ABC transporter ATP-binding protein [Cytobacillus oceanisediminis]USK51834.1 dipeptide/oligopeptide/nickel ABC transporter ATP-binding protein [Bacillus sp. CMF12]
MSIVGPDVLVAKNIIKQYSSGQKAVDQVSFILKKDECLGIVGESGSGKSTLARCLLALEKVDQGEIWFKDKTLHTASKEDLRSIRRGIQAVFQNPAASLNPKLRIIDSLMEPLDFQKSIQPSFLKGIRHHREKAAEHLLEMVKLPSKYLTIYPHELSGGEKQRVTIARAISIEPSLIILDEPTASLDVSIQAKILDLLKALQQQIGVSYLFISHDLAAVNFMSDRIMVMKQGKIVDEFSNYDLFSEKRDSYTKELLNVFEG